MSNAFGDQAAADSIRVDGEAVNPDVPSAPQTRLSVNKSRLRANWLPAGAIMRLNLFAELGFFLVLWAAYGFAMQYVSKPVQRLISLMFSPWAIALVLLVVCLIICRFLASLVLRCKDLQGMALATQHSTDTYDHADTEEAVLDLLYGAKESITKRLHWITTLFCAISSYLIVSLFY
ncbi:MAG: hypothetical protein DCF15_22460 [Phormidesmis priestleyi]|uniref:Uncharacterized protein n=1 Tax=Phormidesmis priestleyi TaxID=268141 RepID=A0A2W4WEV9_9CYAN|nr:MAG: hypothetical protein DCF15_22460 [Phormidesmis priestleyi]